ncbi:hypothetical protein [Algoriphagus antarcticus]|uniref:hypothetical protein n=1 Tax=Algoriphagus antarcticus TaxID=238540 RepID=UPI001123790B|nr:hypothetical protein [Algoriphagus antarcticus]
MKQKKLPFTYRSLAHFYFVFILPTAVLFIIISELFNDNPFSLDQLRSPGFWLGFFAFQIVFGTCMYFWDYKSRSKDLRENS